jgi:hypothetical protein
VKKKGKIFYNLRRLRLTDEPNLMYFEIKKKFDAFKASIPLDYSTVVTKIDNKKMEIFTNNKRYQFIVRNTI